MSGSLHIESSYHGLKMSFPVLKVAYWFRAFFYMITSDGAVGIPDLNAATFRLIPDSASQNPPSDNRIAYLQRWLWQLLGILQSSEELPQGAFQKAACQKFIYHRYS